MRSFLFPVKFLLFYEDVGEICVLSFFCFFSCLKVAFSSKTPFTPRKMWINSIHNFGSSLEQKLQSLIREDASCLIKLDQQLDNPCHKS